MGENKYTYHRARQSICISVAMPYRNEGCFQRKSFLRTHLNEFMDEVGIEIMSQGEIGN